MEVVNWVRTTCRLTESTSGVVIRLLFKKGDRLDVRNYRLVRLVNCDYKIMSGCIAARLSATLPGLIHSDQTGLPGRHCSDNLCVIEDTVE
jgi:hypothetical protein